MDHDNPMFARSEVGELRGECPKDTLNCLDAVSMAEGRTRTALVNEILGAWAAKERHKAMMVHRIAGFNPNGPESAGGSA